MKRKFYPSVDFPKGAVSITPVCVVTNSDGVETDAKFDMLAYPNSIGGLISSVSCQGNLYHIDESGGDTTKFENYFNIHNIDDEVIGGFYTDARTFSNIVIKNGLYMAASEYDIS